MVAHGSDEIIALAENCVVEQLEEINGWQIEQWEMTEDDVTLAIEIYDAVLMGGAKDPVIALLHAAGLDLTALLLDSKDSKDDITRADLCEFAAAASLVSEPSLDIDAIYMPNVPKMSRRKSESGVDLIEVSLQDSSDEELLKEEHLTIVSVKHSVDTASTANLRWNLARSLSVNELTPPYVTTQLRVLNASLLKDGVPPDIAARVYLFLRNFPDDEMVSLYAAAIVAPDMYDDLVHHAGFLPNYECENRWFRMIFMPGIRDVHERCP